jgi:hypothetical protein
MGQVNARKDVERYINSYPGEPDDPSQDLNLKFYRNEIKSMPEGNCYFCRVGFKP